MQTNSDGHGKKKSTFRRATFKIDQFAESHPRENTHEIAQKEHGKFWPGTAQVCEVQLKD